MRWCSGADGAHVLLPTFAALALLALALWTGAVVDGAPAAEAGPDITGYTGRAVLFEGVGTPDPSLRIILYEWDFDGDGRFDWNSTLGGSTTHVFATPLKGVALFRVTQYDASAGGLITASDSTRINVLSGRPVGSIKSSATAEVDTPFAVWAEYYDPDGGEVQYLWDLNDGTTGDEGRFDHRFREIRKYNITLRVTDDEGDRTESQFTLTVVKELPDEPVPRTTFMALAVIALVGLLLIAFVAYRSIRAQPSKERRERREGRAAREAPGEVEGPAGATGGPIMTEPSLEDRHAEAQAAPKRRPRVVAQPRVAKLPVKAKEAEITVPAAPPRLPCPECGTTLGEDGRCPFCTANEAIDTVERRVGELKTEGFVLAEVEDRVEAAKAALHIKGFAEVDAALVDARRAIGEAERDHDRGERLLILVDELMEEARNRDVDTTKAANLLKLSRSFLKTGKYPKSIHYAERSRDLLMEALEPFDLDRYFCTHCKEEVAPEAEQCPQCETRLESGLVKRARRELKALWERLEGIPREHPDRGAITSHLEQAREHVESRSAAAARESIDSARTLLDGQGAAPGAEADGTVPIKEPEVLRGDTTSSYGTDEERGGGDEGGSTPAGRAPPEEGDSHGGGAVEGGSDDSDHDADRESPGQRAPEE